MSSEVPSKKGHQSLRFRDEFRDFWRFIWRPRLGPRLPGQRLGRGWWVVWPAGTRIVRLLLLAVCLWLFNMVILGPLHAAAAGAVWAVDRWGTAHGRSFHCIILAPIAD